MNYYIFTSFVHTYTLNHKLMKIYLAYLLAITFLVSSCSSRKQTEEHQLAKTIVADTSLKKVDSISIQLYFSISD